MKSQLTEAPYTNAAITNFTDELPENKRMNPPAIAKTAADAWVQNDIISFLLIMKPLRQDMITLPLLKLTGEESFPLHKIIRAGKKSPTLRTGISFFPQS
jgi:hypothetical protein